MRAGAGATNSITWRTGPEPRTRNCWGESWTPLDCEPERAESVTAGANPTCNQPGCRQWRRSAPLIAATARDAQCEDRHESGRVLQSRLAVRECRHRAAATAHVVDGRSLVTRVGIR